MRSSTSRVGVALVLALGLFAATNSATAEEQCEAGSPWRTAAWHLDTFDKFTLTYFDGRGLAEVLRTIFVTAGRFPGDGFQDVRLSREGFNEAKGKGDLKANLNRMPVLNHNGNVIGQSSAIARYLARQFGMMGTSDFEAAQIDALCEHIVDIKGAYRKLLPYKNEMSDEEKDAATEMWFTTPATPEIKGRMERQLQWFLDHVEEGLPGDGYSVGGRPSLADAYLFNMLGEHAKEVTPQAKGEPFGDLAAMQKLLAQYPKLSKVVDKFKKSPGMRHYLDERPAQEW